MGMGYGAGYADCVEEKFIKGKARKEFNAFMKAIKKHYDGSVGEFVQDFIYGESDCNSEVADAYVALCLAFEEATGLSLEADYHNYGDRYDEVSGVFWAVSGVWMRTEAGKKYAKQVQRKLFVTYG